MYKVKVTVPATSINLGPGLNVLGLALSLHASVEMLIRSDDKLKIIIEGEGEAFLPDNFDNLVLRAAIRVFQLFESAPAGLQITIRNEIPWDVGLGAQTALVVGGLIAANNLVNGNLKREEIINLAVKFGMPPAGVVAAIYGGLSICSTKQNAELIYCTTDIVPLRVVVALPYLTDYQSDQIGFANLVALDDAVYNIGQTALLVEALRKGDFELLTHAMGDHLHQANYTTQIPAFDLVGQAAYDENAIAVVLSGKGPALLAIAENYHEAVADAIEEAFTQAGVDSDTWILGVDRQGMLVSIVE